MCRCDGSRGKETIIAPSTHNEFPTISISLHHSRTLQNFHLKRLTFLKTLCTKHPKGAFWEKRRKCHDAIHGCCKTCFTSFCKEQKVKGDFQRQADGNGMWLKRHKAAFNREVPPHCVCISAHSISVVVEDSGCQSIHAQWLKNSMSAPQQGVNCSNSLGRSN